MAGINASLLINGKEPFILDRSEAYIGVLIDDLVTKGTNEPYRIMTSRAEYRLVLRQDNADLRLTEKSYRIGLADKERYNRYLEKKRIVEEERERMENSYVYPGDANEFLVKLGSSPLKNRVTLAELLKRPEVTYENLSEIDRDRPELSSHAINQLEVQIKYEGYINKQLNQIEKFKKLENKPLDENLNYDEIEGLRLEAIQKLNQIKPRSVGQASRISGVSPADINVILVYLEKQRRKKH
ncbi:MAG: tRNA uridine-5-carboxymethylaminomethyl(34) synthesis enzyme MnmG, partial [Firmicutes bacterium]|nr:tRNA uridine-5-carboxymethylaminomethyl(34) synthesis enzyme MnmG [Bacillota bacterium]